MRSHIYCLITICLFSTLEVVSKLFDGNVSANAIATWRFFIGGMAMLPFAISAIVTQKIKLSLGSILRVCVLGILNVCISMLLLQWSVYWGKASVSAILVASNPIFVTFFALFILNERASFINIAGIVTGLIGLVLIIFGETELLAGSRNISLGISLALGASVTFGLYTVLAKKLLRNQSNIVINSLSFIAGSIVLGIINILKGNTISIDLSIGNFVAIAYLGLFVTGIAYILYFESLRNLPTATVSMYFFLKPVIASFLAVMIMNENLSLVQLVGIAVIVISQVIARKPSIQNFNPFARALTS